MPTSSSAARPTPLTRAILIIGLSALIMTSFMHNVLATTLLKLDLEALTVKSERIVHGQVEAMEFRKVEGRVYTYVTLEVEETFKGPEEERVTFRVLGGRHGELITLVHGTAQFEQGEEVIVFLERPLKGKPLVVTGMMQGKFHVSVDPEGESRYVVPHLEDASLVERVKIKDRDGQIREKLKETEPDETHAQILELEAFKLKIKGLEERAQ